MGVTVEVTLDRDDLPDVIMAVLLARQWDSEPRKSETQGPMEDLSQPAVS